MYIGIILTIITKVRMKERRKLLYIYIIFIIVINEIENYLYMYDKLCSRNSRRHSKWLTFTE